MATFIGGEKRDVIHVCLESSGSIRGSWVEIKRVCRFDAGWTIKSSESPSTRGMGLPFYDWVGSGGKNKDDSQSETKLTVLSSAGLQKGSANTRNAP